MIATSNNTPSTLVAYSSRRSSHGLFLHGQANDEISGRTARTAFARLKSVLWSRPEISLKTKGCIYEALIRIILLYGCETWPVRAEDLRRLEVFDSD